MATTTRKVNLNNLHTVVGALCPELALSDNKIMTINGHPCQIFSVQTVTTTETNLNISTDLVRVRGGVVFDVTGNANLAIAIRPLSTNARVAVVNAVLAADKTYIVIVYGTEI